MKFKDFKEMFVELTSVTVPHGSEYMFYERYMKPLVDFDCIKSGENYYHVVGGGKSRTLFCSHLDTASSISKPVNHGFEGNYIYSKSNTILGADDKAGVMVMLYLIECGVPGTYFFFAGEEAGRIGSTQAAKDVNFFSHFDRAIQFDRRGYGSIISNQLGGRCCSDSFVNYLANEYKSQHMKFQKDEFGLYTDTASFMKIIPECTNISIGYFKEHTHNEHININYAWQVARASSNIDWDDLPVVRTCSDKEFNPYWGFDDDDDHLEYKTSLKAPYPPMTINVPPRPPSFNSPPFTPSPPIIPLTKEEADKQREAICLMDELLNPVNEDGEATPPPKVL